MEIPDHIPVQLLFEDTNKTIDLVYDRSFIQLLEKIIPGWSFQILKSDQEFTDSFIKIDNTELGHVVSSIYSDSKKLFRDPVDAICEILAQLAWATVEANLDWLCLHCAACEIDGGLVLFPSRKKGGKSTIAATMGLMGIPIHSEDFLAIEIGDNAELHGISNGAAVRLRLPWPLNLSDCARSELQKSTVAESPSYSYHNVPGVMPVKRGKRLPILGIVLLDRNASYRNARLEGVALDDVLTTVIFQNFARLSTAERILAILHFLVSNVQTYQLQYSKAEDGAKTLIDYFRAAEATYAPPLPSQLIAPCFPTENSRSATVADYDPQLPLRQNRQVKSYNIEETVFLAGGEGHGVHKLDQIGSAIWNLMTNPMSVSDISLVLNEAFPDNSPDSMRDDLDKLIKSLLAAELIVYERES